MPRLTPTEKQQLKIAIAKLIEEKRFFSQDAQTAERWTKAIEKAETEIFNNRTINFQNGILRFTSRTSGKPRYVTAHGCASACDCAGNISYHLALFQILNAVGIDITAERPITFKPRKHADLRIRTDMRGRAVEYCGAIRI